MSKLHHTIAKLERILFMPFLGYALFIWVYTFHLGVQLFWGMQLLGGMPFQFGCTHFIWVCTFYLGMHSLDSSDSSDRIGNDCHNRGYS